jgi:hypothetical protein
MSEVIVNDPGVCFSTAQEGTSRVSKTLKSYHITFDKTDGLQINTIMVDLDISMSSPYLLVYELGVTGKEHYHMYFFSSRCKNTLKTKSQKLLKTEVYFSNPENIKYNKYNKDGVKGVEIYLLKGKTNHMKQNDDIGVTPSIILSNKAYYTEARISFIRSIYENTIKGMKDYKKTVAKITTERKETEWQEILKEITLNPIYSPSDIKDYLAYQHYTKEKYNFSENGFKNLYRKILKKVDVNNYKNLIRNKMDLIE